MHQSIRLKHNTTKKPTWELHYHEGRPETMEDLDFDLETRHKKKEVRFQTPERVRHSFS